MADFSLAIPVVLKHEGGYVNDPKDAGGETNFGISKRSYPNVDIAHLTVEQASAIYRADFWDPLRLDQVRSQDVATKVFDSAVLIGKSRAVKFLQRCVGCQDDGIVGANTISRTNGLDQDTLLTSYRAMLASYYEGLVEAVPTDKKFLNGWIKRAQS